MAYDVKISIRNLYKIFGPNPKRALERVESGADKARLLEKHGHVLGLRDVSIEIQERCIQVVMGLSGSGKSTLIRHINRLIEPTAGEITVDGEDILSMPDKELRDFRRFKASMVFQKFALLPHRTVSDNVKYGLKIQGIDADDADKRAQHWIERVGLNGFEAHYPAQLSGGMQQRVGLARALATDADILLMDEAFSALDPLIRNDMQDVLIDLQQELHKTIVFITHDLDEALKLGDAITILRDGSVVQQGSPEEIILKPANDYVSDFILEINRGRVLSVEAVMDTEVNGAGPEIDASTKIEDALQIFNDQDITSARVRRAGDVVGTVSLAAMIEAIARPEGESREVTYR
ncbi:MAG: glycine betaine/L-proline ABC transporter ATP-binding protein [Rhodobacteraceae bacterium]|nr:glycine betaine/L-proline ABC transporter ATP-binding protein [Paracoccaceae bacterium]MCY4139312.1 glycine betaine/L-proline ABC transporter ATP-binding protein [Paracoccaceae bacterium]